MLDALSELLCQPFYAMSAGMESLFGFRGDWQQADATVANLVRSLSVVPARRSPDSANVNSTASPSPISAPEEEVHIHSPELETDTRILPSVADYLARGQDLKRWWSEVENNGGPPNQFPLSRSFNRPNRSYGFFAEAPVGGKLVPVMGNVQEMFYDQIRVPPSLSPEAVNWLWEQLRQFVMKYFMRVSSFRQPETYVDTSSPTPPPAFGFLSWCPKDWDTRSGFGFTQLFQKATGSGVIRPFMSCDRHAIVDQRDIGKLYEWIVLKVRIFNFAFRTRPFGATGPELVFDLNEESYLVVHQDFITYKEHHLPGVLGDYGVGYAFVKSPTQGLFGYGPGEFDAAIELINFRIYETGYISVRMIFISNRPTSVARLVFDPIDWSFRVADALSLGLASRFATPVKEIFSQIPLRVSFDPALFYVSVANAISNGEAERALCISRERLEKLFLSQHFQQHYQAITGSLLTWRQIPDWLDEKNLPSWVVAGLSS